MNIPKEQVTYSNKISLSFFPSHTFFFTHRSYQKVLLRPPSGSSKLVSGKLNLYKLFSLPHYFPFLCLLFLISNKAFFFPDVMPIISPWSPVCFSTLAIILMN